MTAFLIDLNQIDKNDNWKEFQKLMDDLHNTLIEKAKAIAKKYKVSELCAANIQYLRTRSRWTPELEQQLIKIDKAGKEQPNICEFGCRLENVNIE